MQSYTVWPQNWPALGTSGLLTITKLWSHIERASLHLFASMVRKAISGYRLSWYCCVVLRFIEIVDFHFSSLNLLRPCDGIRRHRSFSTLAQVMVCCLMAPSHDDYDDDDFIYHKVDLNKCWLLIKGDLWHSPESNFTMRAQATILYDEFENYTLKMIATSPRG